MRMPVRLPSGHDDCTYRRSRCDRGHAETAVMACTHPRITDMTQSQPRSKRTPTLEIHGRILDAARRIVERDGVDGLTIRALSAQADVSPTSIYQHIGGKQAVCDALIDTYFTDLREQLIAIDESDPVLRLRRAGIIYREHALDAPAFTRWSGWGRRRTRPSTAWTPSRRSFDTARQHLYSAAMTPI
jgi:AcrR family transcriptional regulator